MQPCFCLACGEKGPIEACCLCPTLHCDLCAHHQRQHEAHIMAQKRTDQSSSDGSTSDVCEPMAQLSSQFNGRWNPETTQSLLPHYTSMCNNCELVLPLFEKSV